MLNIIKDTLNVCHLYCVNIDFLCVLIFGLKPSYFSWTLVASSYSGQNQSTAWFDCLPNSAHGHFSTGFYCHFDHPRQCKMRNRCSAVQSSMFWPQGHRSCALFSINGIKSLYTDWQLLWETLKKSSFFWTSFSKNRFSKTQLTTSRRY